MHKASRLSVPVVLSVLALGASAPFVAFATSANITQITFTTSPQTISANAVSAVLTTQTQNSEGTSEKISGGLQTINLHTTSGTGEFSASSTAWVSVTSLGMNSGTANRNFYYRDSTPGTYTLTITAQGKTWTAATQSITVSKANSTTVVTCPALEVYNGSAQAPCTVTVTGAGGLSLTPTPDYINNTDVGTANASYTYAGDTNYNGSSDNKDFSITKRALMGSITADTKVYDRTTDATILTRSLTGVIEGDDVSASGGTATFGDKNIGTSKTVSATSITLTGTDIGNYSYDGNATGTADITAKDLVVSASGTGKVYDGNTGASAAVALSTDAIEGDTVLAHGTAAFEDADVSTDKPVHVTNISIDGADAGNYHLTNTTADTTANITTNEGAVTINPADLTDITYNGTQHSVATTAQDQDSNPIDVTIDVTYDGSATAPTTAGSYAVHAAIDDANYAGSADATLVIAPAELTITPANQSKTYGDTFNFLGTEFTSGELASGDSITSVTLESAGATASAGVLGRPTT